MNRDELILSCQNCVKNLVKKYNNYRADEDLQSIGMIAVVECVDRCLEEEMTDVNQIQSRCNIWAKNRILNDIYKEKVKCADDEFIFEEIEAPEDDELFEFSVRQTLTPRQLEIFDLLKEGLTPEEICEKLNIGIKMFYKHSLAIKEKIKSQG